MAAQGGHEAVRLLLGQGADIEAKDESGWTPLHRAACGGHDAVVQLLESHIVARVPRRILAWPSDYRHFRADSVCEHGG